MAQTNPASAVADITRNTELWDKIKFTFLCLVLYRLGSHITAPGIDVVALTDFFANKGGGGLLGLYDLFVGGGLSRATVFALGIMPYISASIFIQIAGAVLPQVEKMQKDEEGRKTVNQWTRYITIGLAVVQGWGFALFTSSLENAVITPGFAFKLQMDARHEEISQPDGDRMGAEHALGIDEARDRLRHTRGPALQQHEVQPD